MLLDYRELSLNKAVDDCSAVRMDCVNCYVISSIKALLTISFRLTITRTLNSLRTWLAYSRAFLDPTMHQTRANPSRKWLQSQSKNRVKNLRSGMGVASLVNNRPFPSAQNRAKPGSVKAALQTFATCSKTNLTHVHLNSCMGSCYWGQHLLPRAPSGSLQFTLLFHLIRTEIVIYNT